MVTLFLGLTVVWFVYAFFRVVQELLLGLAKVPRAVTELNSVYDSEKNEGPDSVLSKGILNSNEEKD